MRGNGAHTLVLLLLLSEFIEESTQFLFCSNMSMTENHGDGVENNGFEPLTPCLQSRCSSQLS